MMMTKKFLIETLALYPDDTPVVCIDSDGNVLDTEKVVFGNATRAIEIYTTLVDEYDEAEGDE